jgi:UDP-N-acetylmuramoylalanine--D-glutamate ligase
MPLKIPDLLQAALTKPVAIFGAGLSGQGVQALMRNLGLPAVVYDQNGVQFSAAKTKDHALVVFSPGFAANHPWLTMACAAGVECMGELDFAALFWRGQIIAVTGTNGKTTLTEFLTHALRHVWETAHAVGNIGRPFSRLVADTTGGNATDIAICEVSSFQAETIQHFRADAVLWTNFAEDHLDRHSSMDSYFNAKWALVGRTADANVFAGSSVYRSARRFNCSLPMAAWIETEDQPADPALGGTVFAEYPQRENYLLASAWWQHSKRDSALLLAAAKTFRLGRHRLAQLGTFAGVTYWNDSKATNFHAVEAALSGFKAPVHLILGGKSKGGDVSAFVTRIGGAVRSIQLIGETRQDLALACAAQQIPHQVCDSLDAALQQAAASAKKGEHVLLSPGFASFDMFQSYEDRGDQFEHLVRNLAGTANLN